MLLPDWGIRRRRRAVRFRARGGVGGATVYPGLDDFPTFELIATRTTINTGFASPSQIYENWSGDFDYLYERMGQGVYILAMHPQTIGRGHRLLMLEGLFEHTRARDGESPSRQ